MAKQIPPTPLSLTEAEQSELDLLAAAYNLTRTDMYRMMKRVFTRADIVLDMIAVSDAIDEAPKSRKRSKERKAHGPVSAD